MEYRCKCGHTFPEDLGRYGCPNCEGENPVKLLSMESIVENLKKERASVLRKLQAVNLLLESYGENKEKEDKLRSLRKTEFPEYDVRLNGVYIEVVDLFERGGYKSNIVRGQIYQIEKIGQKGLAIRDGLGRLRWFSDKNINHTLKDNFKFVK